MTLVEIIVVVSIITFLAVLILVAFRSQLFKGTDAKRKSDIRRIQTAIEEYEKDHDCYPLPQVVVCSPGTGLVPYLSKIPCDPDTKASYYYEHEGVACPHWYRIYANLANVNDLDIGKLGCTNGCGPGSSYNYIASSPNAPPGTGQGGDGDGDGGPPSGFYGCRSGICVPISWDPTRPGPECDPNYQSTNCYNQCPNPGNECTSWK
ncbi:MAG: hypothetical protein UU03_C0001G0014 [Candidatus Woesebacteria bacterium GW2011_GWA1_40_45]|nr:MAG: hypothetical protein UT72_C0001G0014 [Candidatus Woesebacteria bacterium GW2011_GWB1_40_101]KKR63664.1 MAG: hypothetical protein UU03_C0001G0014 [Candidatus Woesebacteria bacterium GW2011_GWA1_40_45]